MNDLFKIEQIDIPQGVERELERLYILVDEGGDTERAWAMKRIEAIHEVLLGMMSFCHTIGPKNG